MRICGSCGQQAGDEHSFCAKCGGPIVSASAPLPKAPAPNPPPPPPPPATSPPSFLGTQMMPSATPRLSTARFRLTVTRPDGGTSPPHLLDEPVIAGTQGDLRLESDPFVAPEHACFGLHDGVVEVTDLPESGGTWLGLAPGTPVRVPLGGSLRIGRQVLRLQPIEPILEDRTTAWGSPDRGGRARLLQVLEGGAPGAAWLLPEGESTVGREGCDLNLTGDTFISGRHGRFVVGPQGKVTYEDLGSSNGSFIAIEETTRLDAGDRLFLGQHLIWVDHA